MSTYEPSSDVKRIIEEMNALNAVLTASTPTQVEEARALVRAVERTLPEPVTVSETVLRAAMSKITGSPAPAGTPLPTEDTSWDSKAFELVGLAWLAWLRGDPTKATACLVVWTDGEEMKNQMDQSRKGAVQAYTVSLWATAIASLLAGNKEEARKFYHRVHDVGSSFGTESHPVILWTMAAIFTPGC